MTAISDNFTNVDSTPITSHTAGGVNWSLFRPAGVANIQGNKVVFGEDGGTQAGGILSGRVFTTDDQWSQVDYDTSKGNMGPFVRGSIVGDAEAGGGSGEGYILRIYPSGFQVCRLNGTGSLTILFTGPAQAATGVARLQVEGTTLTATINGSVVATVTDSSISGGKRAGVNWSTGTPEADNFSASDVNVSDATSYEFNGPEIGAVGVASTNFQLQPFGGDWPSGQSVSVSSSGSGTFTPAGPYSPSGSDPIVFTYTPSSLAGSPHVITPAASPGLGTDPDAIDYTVVNYSTVNTLSPNGTNIEILVPLSYDPDAGANLVVYCHGNNGTETEAGNRNVAEQAAFIDALIAAGYIVVASRMNGNNWGNEGARADMIDAYAYCVTEYRLLDTLIWSGSMGGLAGLNAIADGWIPRIKGWLGVVPVCNLANVFANNGGGFSAGIRAAYSIAANGSDYATQTDGSDPLLRPASAFSNIGMMFIASPSDTLVSKTENSDLMLAHVTDDAYESSVVEHTGSHGDSSRYAKALSEGIPFFIRCLAIPDGSGGSVPNLPFTSDSVETQFLFQGTIKVL